MTSFGMVKKTKSNEKHCVKPLEEGWVEYNWCKRSHRKLKSNSDEETVEKKTNVSG